MNFAVRLNNSNLVMGNIKEMALVTPKENKEKEILLDFLFERDKTNNNFDKFEKI